MQINRLFEMVYLLLDRKNMTAGELAEHFEVSVRTVYRDIEALSEAGIPIYTVKGKGGGIRLTENYVLNKSVLTGEERKMILQSLYGMNAVRREEAEPVLSRLSALFGGESEDWIEIEFSAWNGNHPVSVRFEQLKKAVFSHRTVTFFYSGANGSTSLRRVELLKLVFRASGWYLYGWCTEKKDFRFFKLSRMDDLALTEDIFERKTAPKPLWDMDGEKREMLRKNSRITVTARIARRKSYRVLEEFDRASIKTEENGSFLVDIVLPDDDWLCQYLLSFGRDLEVLSPADVRERMREELKKALEPYETPFYMTD